MFGLGFGELVVIFLVVFLLFGPKALPDIARSLGQAIRQFKKEVQGFSDNINSSLDDGNTDAKKQANHSKENEANKA